MGMFDRFRKKPEPKTRAEPKPKEPVKSDKELATEKNEPYVSIVKMDIDPNNLHQGAFELDWNDEFVNMLKQNGYKGASEEEIVDRWFQSLCRTIGNEQGVDVTGAGYVQINRREDGKTEVS